MSRRDTKPIQIHHRATRPGFFFHLLRNLAIGVSGLGCIVTALGALGIILILARLFQFGMQGFASRWENLWQTSSISLLKPAVGLIIVGIAILLGGLIVNWIVTTPVYHSRDEQKDS